MLVPPFFLDGLDVVNYDFGTATVFAPVPYLDFVRCQLFRLCDKHDITMMRAPDPFLLGHADLSAVPHEGLAFFEVVDDVLFELLGGIRAIV